MNSVAKAVLTTKVDPVYDDLPEERYHFPRTYLNQINNALNDLIVYYEPRRSTGDLSSSGGRQCYTATARISDIVADPNNDDYYYALIADYLEFTNPVPFKEGDFYFESLLKRPDGGTNKGAFGRSVRNMPDEEFSTIWQAGFGHIVEPFDDTPEPLKEEKRKTTRLVSRTFRDQAFSSTVKNAYGHTCAMSGLKILNKSGHSEPHAAHIRPVKDDGPDSSRNGIALSRTLHWMFDEGLVSIDEDFTILVAKDRLPSPTMRLFGKKKSILLPEIRSLQPHPQFLEYHRKNIYMG